MKNDPRTPEEIIEDHKRADEFAVKGTVMHFLLRQGFFPSNEEAAEAILVNIIEEVEALKFKASNNF